MSNIIPFSNDVPAALSSAFTMFADINRDVVGLPKFSTLSIRGKVFTLKKDGIKTILKRPGPDGEDEAAQALGVVILRANMHAKTYYSKRYSEGESEGALPDCYSYDSVAPSVNSPKPQASKCALCPHNQWNSRAGDGTNEEGKGKACADNARLAIAAPDKLSEPMLLRVPPASLKPLREAVKELNTRKVPYNAAVTRISFDPTAPSPKLLFKPVGLMPQDTFAALKEMYDNELVRTIVGLEDVGAELVAPGAGDGPEAPYVAAEEVMRRVAVKPASPAVAAAVEQVFAEPAAPEPVAEKPKRTRAVAPAPAAVAPVATAAPAPSGAVANLLGDMDALLSNFDD